MRLGGATFDDYRGVLLSEDGETIPLRPQALDVLRYLAAHHNETISKEELFEAVWPGICVTDDSIYQVIIEIRRALGRDGRALLETVPKRGYRLVPDSASPRRWAWRAAALAVVVVLALAVWLYRPAPIPDATDSRGPSIAVLPFEAISDDARWARLGRGLATEIANELARNRWLYVTAPEATRDVTAEPMAAGRDLKVRFVVSGTIQAEGDRLRVVAALADANSAEVLWSDRWSGGQDHLFSIQDAVVSRIGASLASSNTGVLPQSDLSRAKRKPTDRLDAYDHYLLGVELKHTFDPGNYPASIAHLKRAVALDPDFARGWAILALVNGFQADRNTGQTALGFQAASIAAAERAYALDPEDPEVLYNYARAIGYLGRNEEARAVLQKATDVAPNNADILLIVSWLGGAINMDGPTLLAWADRAFELNPKPPFWYYLGRAEAAFFAGDYSATVDSAGRGPKSIYRYLFLALAEALRGNLPEARTAAGELRALAPDFTLAGYFEGIFDQVPKRDQFIKAARLAGIPVAAEDLVQPWPGLSGANLQPASEAESPDQRP